MTPLSGRRAQARAGAAAINERIAEATHQLEQERQEQYAAAKAAHEQHEATRHRYTREELTDVAAIRDRNGWHRVTTVNAKTVSVETGYSWTDRIPFDRILDAKWAS